MGPPAPVAVVQPTDRYTDCTGILAESLPTTNGVKQLAADKGLKTTQNVAAGVAGVFIPVLWFGMDFQGTADTEITAPQSRQQYLSILADQKGCGEEPAPVPPPVARAKPRAKPQPVADAAAPAVAAAKPATQWLLRRAVVSPRSDPQGIDNLQRAIGC